MPTEFCVEIFVNFVGQLTVRAMTLLELETQYANLTPSGASEFIQSIRAVDKDPDVSTLLLVGKLEQFIAKFRAEGKRICASGASMSQDDRDRLTLHGRIIAAFLVILHRTNSVSALREYTLLFLEYASAVVRTKYDYLSTALDVISYRITALGIDYHVVRDTSSLDLLSYKLIEGLRFDKTRGDTFSFQGRGRVLCRDGKLSVCSSDALESGAKAFSICGERVSVMPRNIRDEKLKSTEQFDAGALRSFADTFLRVQKGSARKGAAKHEYQSGEEVDIQLLDISENGESLVCEIVDKNVELKGTVLNEELIKGLWTKNLIDYISEDDCVRGAVLYKDVDGNTFSIADAYAAYARERAERDFRDNACFQARVYNINESWGRVNWITPSGYGGITRLEDTPDVKVGDMAVLQVLNVQRRGSDTYINLCPPKYDVDSVRAFSEEDVLRDFVTDREKVLSAQESEKVERAKKGTGTLEALSSILSSTVARGSSMDAYRHLLVALFLSEVQGDEKEVERLHSEAYYLGQCLSFSQGDKVVPVRGVSLSPQKESVVRMLSAWDNPKEDIRIEVSRWEGDTVPGKIAGLLLATRMTEAFKDEVRTDRETVRRRICSLLGVADSFETEGGLRKGKYGSVEGQEVEFKSSYVFRNDGKGADIEAQGRGEVFEAVCGFLNADGGVLYLGVNDQGDPILAKDSGLNADKAWLHKHRLQVNRDRFNRLGHSTVMDKIGVEGNLDTLVQFLDGEKELYFKEAFWGNITIVVTEDNDAIKIIVEPAKYEIAYLYSDRTRSDGVAYVRDGGRTVPMSRILKEQRLTDLKQIAKEMSFVVTIQEAIDKHQRLIFKNYASGNSGEVKDRYVVPVNLFYNDENVYCLDLESKKFKQFRLHRIGAIEPSEDSSPYTLPVMPPKEADVFRWIMPDGGRSYHIRLRMDVGAKNYLLEEYSCAEKLPKEEFYEEEKNKWILDTHVNGLGAVRRFYLGLADKIEILDTEDSEELRKEIGAFIKEYIESPE